MHNILSNSRHPSKRDIIILYDFRKAFDSISVGKLWEILNKIAVTKEEIVRSRGGP